MRDNISPNYLEINCLYAILFIFLRLKTGQLSIKNGYRIYTYSETGPRTIDCDLFPFKVAVFSPIDTQSRKHTHAYNIYIYLSVFSCSSNS